ncbi:MAG TPA: hypothetical protein VGB88_12475 [Alphaproteobacteria bacterium]
MFSLDPDLSEDVTNVLDSAGLLEVSEFEVFRMAYASWFGEPTGDSDRRVLDRYFFDYLYRDKVPPWARAFTREVVRRADANCLDLADYGIVHPPPTPTMIYLGIRYAIWAAFTIAFIVATAHMVNGPEGCILPPCY